MIEYRKGDILKSGADALVNPVNCVGTSGKGLALAFAKAYPRWADVYKAAAKRGDIRLGHVWRHAATPDFGAPIIYAFPTKGHWREASKFFSIDAGLDALVADVCGEFGPRAIAVPALGCGCGGLAWSDVRPLVQAAAEKMSAAGVDVYVYEPMG